MDRVTTLGGIIVALCILSVCTAIYAFTEAENLVLLDWPAAGYTVLIAVEQDRRRGKEIAAIQIGVAQKFPRIAMELVGSGTNGRLDSSATVSAVDGAVVVSFNRKFL